MMIQINDPRCRALSRLDGARISTLLAAYLRGCAGPVTVTTAERAAVSGGVTVQLTRTGRRRLASAALSW
jgi:hypothetical protein